jgi:hypothetical protein
VGEMKSQKCGKMVEDGGEWKRIAKQATTQIES